MILGFVFGFFFSKRLYNPFVEEKDSLILRPDDLSEVPEHRYLLRALSWLKISLLGAVDKITFKGPFQPKFSCDLQN